MFPRTFNRAIEFLNAITSRMIRTSQTEVRRCLLLGCFFLACLVPPGCGGDPLQKVKVQGTVTFDGGPCPGPGRVTFSPQKVADGFPMRIGRGKFQVDGKYQATSFQPGDGLVPGTYRVGVACFDASKLSGAPSDDEFRDASYVASDYEGEELVIEPGSAPITLNLDVPKRVR